MVPVESATLTLAMLGISQELQSNKYYFNPTTTNKEASDPIEEDIFQDAQGPHLSPIH